MLAQVRPYSQFMVWNHVFIAYEVYRAYGLDKILFVLGATTVVLSTLRHRHAEQRYNTVEPLVAKLSQAYIMYEAAQRGIGCLGDVLCPKAVLLGLWLVEDHTWLGGFEILHPWLHIVAALDAHVYLDCCAK